MGFSSYECRGCGRSLISHHAANDTNKWMTTAVAMFEDGSQVIGEYDGYLRIEGFELYDKGTEPECWHKACWVLAGKPSFTKPSAHAGDQGYFFDEKDYDVKNPLETGVRPEKLRPEHSMLGGR